MDAVACSVVPVCFDSSTCAGFAFLDALGLDTSTVPEVLLEPCFVLFASRSVLATLLVSCNAYASYQKTGTHDSARLTSLILDRDVSPAFPFADRSFTPLALADDAVFPDFLPTAAISTPSIRPPLTSATRVLLCISIRFNCAAT